MLRDEGTMVRGEWWGVMEEGGISRVQGWGLQTECNFAQERRYIGHFFGRMRNMQNEWWRASVELWSISASGVWWMNGDLLGMSDE